jgi:hypothetical protein
MKRIWLFLLLIAGVKAGYTAEAALFNDGGRAVLRPWNAEDGPLLDVDLRSGAVTELDAAALGLPPGFVPQGCSKSDFVLGTTGSKLLACDLVKKKTVTIYTAPEGVQLEDLAYNAKDGGILLLCSDSRDDDRRATNITTGEASSNGYRSPLLYVPTDTSQACFVFCRRVESVEGACFDNAGNLYFSCRGDVWAGRIEKENDGELKYVLTGMRVAPAAVLETYIGTSASTGVHEVAVGGRKLYLHSSRLGGSGLGDLFTVDLQAPGKEPDGDSADLVSYSKRASRILDSVRLIAPYDRPPYLASSPNGKYVMYGLRSEDSYDFSVVDTEKGTTRKIAVKLPTRQ